MSHFDPRTKHFLPGRTVSASSGPFVAGHHDENDETDKGDQQKSGHDRHDDGHQLQIGFQLGNALHGAVESFVALGTGAAVDGQTRQLVQVVTVRRAFGSVVANRFLSIQSKVKIVELTVMGKILIQNYVGIQGDDPAGILAVAVTSAIVFALAQAAVTARRIETTASDAGIVTTALVHVHFAEVSFVSGRRAVAGEIVDAVDATPSVQTRTLGAFVDVDFAIVASESFVALTNVALRINLHLIFN